MSSDEPQINSIAPVRNVAALSELVARVRDRETGLPGMGTFYGFSGYGKTFATTYAEIRHDAVRVELKSTWTQAKLCQSILREMAQEPRRTVSDMVDQITVELATSGRVLLIDEADHLVKRGAIEIVRDIADGSGAATILIGEEALPQKLARWERVHGRMLDWVRAEPATMADFRHMETVYAPGVEIAEDLRVAINTAARGSLRRIAVNLAHALETSRRTGVSKMDRKAWGDRPFWTGTAPAPRRDV
ncbi:MAG: AAA family ATPase [Paracoccaceae bacterium]